jgi:AraC family ethanolamine operon transcriptional activator
VKSPSVHHATDPWEHAQAFPWGKHDYRQLRPGKFFGCLQTLQLGGLSLHYERIEQPYSYRGRLWAGGRVFGVASHWSGEVYSGGRVHSPDTVVSCGDRYAETLVFGSRFEAVFIVADESLMRDNAFHRWGRTKVPGIESDMWAPPSVAAATYFRDNAQELLRTGVADNENARRILRLKAVEIILSTLEWVAPIPADRVRSSTRAYIVSQAIDIIESRLDSDLDISQVCQCLRVSSRTLRDCFMKVLRVSPYQYILSTRLNRVRSDLRHGQHRSIENAAMRWGFSHMGRFAKFYKRTFGESPTETRRSVHFVARRRCIT